jgi:hypothetical protein
MRTIFDHAERRRLLGRMTALTPTTQARWGRMTAPQMLCHLIDALQSSAAPAPPHRTRGALTYPPLKQLVIYVLPWPRGRLQSPPDLLVTKPSDWATDVARFGHLLESVAARDPRSAWPASDVFGPMTGRDWGALLRTHINHHLRQFGV